MGYAHETEEQDETLAGAARAAEPEKHAERRAWCEEISAINQALDGKTQHSLTDV